MIAGFILGTIYAPVQPEISVKAENLLGEGKTIFGIPAVNTLPTLLVTIFIIILPLAWATRNSLKKSAETDLVPRGVGNLMEAILELLYNLTEGSAGKYAKMIFPWFATIMIYVLIANLLKLIPGFESVGFLHQAAQGHPVQGSLLMPGEVEN